MYKYFIWLCTTEAVLKYLIRNEFVKKYKKQTKAITLWEKIAAAKQIKMMREIMKMVIWKRQYQISFQGATPSRLTPGFITNVTWPPMCSFPHLHPLHADVSGQSSFPDSPVSKTEDVGAAKERQVMQVLWWAAALSYREALTRINGSSNASSH